MPVYLFTARNSENFSSAGIADIVGWAATAAEAELVAKEDVPCEVYSVQERVDPVDGGKCWLVLSK